MLSYYKAHNHTLKMNKLRHLLKISIIVFALFIGIINTGHANYYAYVPDLSDRSLSVINTNDQVKVQTVPLHGSPRDVLVNHAGTYVFVTTEVDSANRSDSFLNVVSTNTLSQPNLLAVNFEDVRGMAISSDDASLFITHKVGVTRLDNPVGSNRSVTDVATDYRGAAMALTPDDRLLFVVGSNEGFDGGVSVIDASTMEQLFSFPLGTGVDTSAIALDVAKSQLYVTNRATSELVVLRINNINDPSNITLEETTRRQLDVEAHPFALALDTFNSQLYVSLSYVKIEGDFRDEDAYEEIGTGEGLVAVFNTNNLNGNAIPITISAEGAEFEGGPPGSRGKVHPASIAFNNDGVPFLLKRIWAQEGGLFISEIEVITPPNGNTSYSETNSMRVSEIGSVFANGKFIGPRCDSCPTGVDETTTTRVQRPSALGPIFLALFAIVAVFRKRFYGNYETHHSRPRRRH